MNDSPFVVDSVQTGVWFQVSYILRPTRPLQYIAIGALHNPYQPYQFSNSTGGSFYFFIDDIEIREIPNADTVVQKKSIAYPYLGRPKARFTLPVQKVPFKGIVYFAVNTDSLTVETRAVLDSVIATMKKERTTIFSLRGHADNTGHDNRNLSQKRTATVRKYLIEVGKLPAYRFTELAFGSDSAIANNQTEAGRRLNRRVEIQEISADLPKIMYQKASVLALQGNLDSAFYYLKIWLSFESSDKILLLHDPDLAALHPTKGWKMIENNVKNAYKKYPQPALSFQLDNLYLKDQRYRSINQLYKDAKGTVPLAIDTIDWIRSFQKVHELDSLNLLELLPLLDKEPWPGPLLVGERQRTVFPYILLHSENYMVMKKYLPYLERACRQNTAEWQQYANLYDRISVKDKGIQRYGTQYRVDPKDETVYRLAPIEDVEKLDSVRAGIGLPPIDPYASFRIIRHE